MVTRQDFLADVQAGIASTRLLTVVKKAVEKAGGVVLVAPAEAFSATGVMLATMFRERKTDIWADEYGMAGDRLYDLSGYMADIATVEGARLNPSISKRLIEEALGVRAAEDTGATFDWVTGQGSTVVKAPASERGVAKEEQTAEGEGPEPPKFIIYMQLPSTSQEFRLLKDSVLGPGTTTERTPSMAFGWRYAMRQSTLNYGQPGYSACWCNFAENLVKTEEFLMPPEAGRTHHVVAWGAKGVGVVTSYMGLGIHRWVAFEVAGQLRPTPMVAEFVAQALADMINHGQKYPLDWQRVPGWARPSFEKTWPKLKKVWGTQGEAGKEKVYEAAADKIRAAMAGSLAKLERQVFDYSRAATQKLGMYKREVQRAEMATQAHAEWAKLDWSKGLSEAAQSGVVRVLAVTQAGVWAKLAPVRVAWPGGPARDGGNVHAKGIYELPNVWLWTPVPFDYTGVLAFGDNRKGHPHPHVPSRGTAEGRPQLCWGRTDCGEVENDLEFWMVAERTLFGEGWTAYFKLMHGFFSQWHAADPMYRDLIGMSKLVAEVAS